MKYDQFIRQSGVVRRSNLANPKLVQISDFKLPDLSILHYIPESETIKGPRPDDPLLLNVVGSSTTAMVEHLTRYSDPMGNPKKIADTSNRMVTAFHRSYRLMRRMRRKEVALANKRVLPVINYGIISDQYKFVRSAFSEYWKAMSLINTLVDSINSYSGSSDRHQFVRLYLQNKQLEVEDYRKLGKTIPRTRMQELTSPDFWMIALFSWLSSANKENSPFVKLTRKSVNLLNLCFVVDTQVTVLPMNVLLEVREAITTNADKVFYDYMDVVLSHRKVELPDIISEELPAEIETVRKLDDEIKHTAEAMADSGKITAAEYRRLVKLSTKYETIPSPFGKGSVKDLAESASKISSAPPKGDLIKLDTVLDDSMSHSSLKSFDGDYVENVMQSDVAASVLALQNAGVAVTNYRAEKVTDAANSYYSYSVQVTPAVGKVTTLNFQLPIVQPDGTFVANGVKNRMDKQRADMPIRKVSPSRVALTSYYGKLFIDRDERVQYNYGRWLANQLVTLSNSGDFPIKLSFDDKFVADVKTPLVYSSISKRISTIKYKSYSLSFDYSERDKLVPGGKLSPYESKGMIVCGKTSSSVVTVDSNNTFYAVKDNKYSVIGDINDLLDGSLGIGPVNMVSVKIFGTSISLGLLMAYRYGLTKLLRILKAKFRRVRKGTRVAIEDEEYTISFKDEVLIFSREDVEASLIVSGFNQFKTVIKDYPIDEFDKPNIYLNVLEGKGMGIRHLREVDLMYQMFIDPITLEILKDIKEPTTLTGLFLRATELLSTDDHPRETDMAYMRIRGYERLSGLVYSELVKAMRGYNAKPKTASSQIEMNPRGVWMGIVTDTSLMLVEDLNPINNLKEKERLSYSGLGGRDAQTMVKRTREFHPNDRGVVSEATPDSGKAGATTYLSADPSFTNLRGVTKQISAKDGQAKQLSTTALLLPCADRED